MFELVIVVVQPPPSVPVHPSLPPSIAMPIVQAGSSVRCDGKSTRCKVRGAMPMSSLPPVSSCCINNFSSFRIGKEIPQFLKSPTSSPLPLSLPGRQDGECREGLPSSRCSSGARAAPPEAKPHWRTFQQRFWAALQRCRAFRGLLDSDAGGCGCSVSVSRPRLCLRCGHRQASATVLLSHSLLHLPFRTIRASTTPRYATLLYFTTTPLLFSTLL